MTTSNTQRQRKSAATALSINPTPIGKMVSAMATCLPSISPLEFRPTCKGDKPRSPVCRAQLQACRHWQPLEWRNLEG